VRGGLLTLAVALFVLAVLDLLVAFFVGPPPAGDLANASRLVRYFEYGRSIEGKVRAMVDAAGRPTHPLVDTGWIESPETAPDRPGNGQDLLVAVYGMSFIANIAKQMPVHDPRVAVRFAGGPGAPLNHTYAMYLADRGKHRANVVVIGILASRLPALTTITHMTSSFEAPSPHFYPRYVIENGKLVEWRSSIGSREDFIAALKDRSRWNAMVGELQRFDEFYDPLVFNSWSLDGSSLARLARRAWGQRAQRETMARFQGAGGFTNNSDLLDVTRALLHLFVSQVNSDGQVPVVVAINDRGQADHLHRVLEPMLVTDDAAARKVVYMSTHRLAPSSDNSNFIRDGHFKSDKDSLMGRHLLDLINQRLGRS